MTNAPKFYDVRLSGGPLTLCAACVAVMVQEGSVAGDPREEAVPASDVVRMSPRHEMPSDPNPPTCDTCSTREACEAALNDARAATCVDAAFGTPEEHARWHAVHDTPTLAELEGEDACRCQPEHEVTCHRCTAALEADLAALSY